MPVKKLSKAQLLAAKATLEANLAAHSEELKQNPQPGNQSVFHSLLALVGQLIVLAEDDYLAVNGDPAAEAVLALLCDSIELATKVKWNSYWSLLANSTTAKNLQTRSKQLIDEVLDNFLMQHLKGEHWDLCLKLLNFGLPEDKRIGTVEEKQIEVSLDEAIAACNKAQGILKEKSLAPSSQLHVIFAASLAQQCVNRYAVATEAAESLKKTVAKDTPEQVEYKRQRRVMLLSVFLQDGEPNLGLGDIVSANQDPASPDQEGDPLTIEGEQVTPITTTVSTAPDTTPATSTTALTTNALSAAEQQQVDETRQVTAGVEHILTTLIEEEKEHLRLLTGMSNTLAQLIDDLRQRIGAAKRHVLVANKQFAVVQLLLGDCSDEDVECQLLVALMYNDPLWIEAANTVLQALYKHWYTHESYVLASYLSPKPDWQENSTLLVGELMAYRRHPRTCEAVKRDTKKECARIDSEYQKGDYIRIVKPLEEQVEEMKTVQAGITQAVANANEHQKMLAEVKNDKGRVQEIVGELQQQKIQYVTGWFNAVIAWFSKDYKAICDSIRTVCEAAEAVVTAGDSEDVTARVNKVLDASAKIIQLERALDENGEAKPTSRFMVRRFVQNRVRTRVNNALKSTVAPTTTVASLFQSKAGEKCEEYSQVVASHRRAIASVA